MIKVAYIQPQEDLKNPYVAVSGSGKILFQADSVERGFKMAMQDGFEPEFRIEEEAPNSNAFEIEGKNISQIASEIREDGETWSSAMQRAGQLLAAVK